MYVGFELTSYKPIPFRYADLLNFYKQPISQKTHLLKS